MVEIVGRAPQKFGRMCLSWDRVSNHHVLGSVWRALREFRRDVSDIPEGEGRDRSAHAAPHRGDAGESYLISA